jgi:hypothetical protein
MKQTPITRSAKGEACSVRLPGICCNDNETTVFAHISGVRFGHGVGKKTSFGAYACVNCHDVLDGRVKHHFERDYLKLVHLEGVIETLIKLEAKGLIAL